MDRSISSNGEVIIYMEIIKAGNLVREISIGIIRVVSSGCQSRNLEDRRLI